MQIKIGTFEYTECWDGVLYKALSDPPHITDWEMQTVADFIALLQINPIITVVKQLNLWLGCSSANPSYFRKLCFCV